MTVESGGPAQMRLWLDRQIEKEIPGWEVRWHKELHFGTLREVLDRSPVGNPTLWNPPGPSDYVGGRFRGNWQSTTPRDNKDREVENAEDRRPTEIVLDNRGDLSALKPYSRSYLVNNVPYSVRLAEGWSRQAPSGWVDEAIMASSAQWERAG